MSLRTVGSIGIDVQPDTSGFNKGLKDKLREAEKTNHVDIPVRPSTDANAATGDKSMAEKIRTVRNDIQRRIDGAGINLSIPVRPLSSISIQEVRSTVNNVNRQVKAADISLDIPLRIDPSQVAKDLKEAIGKAEQQLQKDLKLKVKVEFDSEHAKLEWDVLKHDLSGDTVELKADLDRQGRVKAELAVLTRNRVIDLALRISKRSMATVQAQLGSLTGVNVLKDAALSLEEFGKNLDSLAVGMFKWGTIVATGATSVLGLTSSIAGLAGGLAELGGFALAAPAGLVALGGIAVVGKASFQGFSAAIKGTKGAMEKLPPQARAAAEALKGTWKEIQTPIQEAFWGKMSGAFEGFVKKVLPEVKGGLVEVGAAAGSFGNAFLRSFSQVGNEGVFTGIFRDLSSSIQGASIAIGPLVDGFLALAKQGAKSLPDMGKAFRDMAVQFDQWAQRSIANGNVTKWIENAKDAAHDLGRALIGIKGQFSAILDAARAGGASDLGTFADKMERIRGIMEGPVFQDTMRNLFGGAHEAIQSMKSGLGELGNALNSLAPSLRSVMVISGDTIGKIFSSIADAISRPAFKEGLVSFFKGANEGITKMLQFLPNVSDGLGKLFDLLGAVAKNILPVVGQMFGGVADVFASMQDTLKSLVPALANFASNTLGIFFQALNLLAVPMKIILDFFTKLPSGVQTAMLALIMLKKYTGGGGIFGGFTKDTAGVTRALQNDIPNATSATRNALSRPMGTGFLSASAFAPMVQQIKALPIHANDAISQMGRSFSAFARGGSVSAIGTAMSAAGFRGMTEIGRGVTGLSEQVTTQSRTMGERLGGAFTKAGAVGKSAMGGLFNFIGGGWGVAFAAGFAILSDMQKQTQILDAANKAVAQSYKDIAKAAIDAGQGIGGAAAQVAALARAQDVMSQGLGTFGKGSLGDIFGNLNVSANDLVNTMTGSATDETIRKLKAIKDSMDVGNSNLFGFGTSGELQANQAAIDGMINTAEEAKKKWDEIWKNDATQGAAVTAALEDVRKTSMDGKVTLDNIRGIRADVFGNIIPDADKVSQLASSFDRQLGGSTKEIQSRYAAIKQSIVDFKNSHPGASMDEIETAMVQTASKMGVPVAAIKEALSSLGLSSEENTRKITFMWGAVTDSTGAAVAVLGEQIPKIREGSDGIGELANALGSAASIDPDVLAHIFRMDGIDMTKMATDLPAAGVGLDQIRAALTATGMSDTGIATAMAAAAEAAGKITAATGTNLQNLTDFSDALKAIRDASDTAADKATKLYDALDVLNGGVRSSLDSTANLADQIRGFADFDKAYNDAQAKIDEARKSGQEKVDKAKADAIGAADPAAAQLAIQTAINDMNDAIAQATAEAGKVPSKWAELNQIFLDPSKADATVEGYADISKSLSGLAKGGIQEAASKYSELFKSTGDSQQAMAAAQAALAPMQVALLDIKDKAGLTDAQYQTMLRTFNLTPDQITISVVASTEGPLADLAKLELQLSTVSAGATVPVAMSGDAAAALTGLGFQVDTLSNGQYAVHVSSDPTVAEQQLQELKNRILTGPAVPIAVGADVSPVQRALDSLNVYTLQGKLYRAFSQSIPTSALAALHANGGLAETITGAGQRIHRFASGGFENHSAFVTSSLRVFGEPETGGEAYIPLAQSKRARSMEILSEVANRFGLTLEQANKRAQQYSNGGMTSQSAPTVTGGVVINQYNPVTEKDSTGVLRAGQMVAAIGMI